MKKILVLLLAACFFFVSCEKESTLNKLIGYWQLETELYEGEMEYYDLDDYHEDGLIWEFTEDKIITWTNRYGRGEYSAPYVLEGKKISTYYWGDSDGAIIKILDNSSLTLDWGDNYICTYKRLKVLPFNKD